MKQTLKSIRLSAAIALSLALSVSVGAAAPDNGPEVEHPLQSAPYQNKVSKDIIKKLHQAHYKSLKLDDAASEKILERYIESLDPLKLVFLADDIAQFRQYEHRLDDDLKRGNLKVAYHVFNRYYERRLERLEYLLNDLDKKIQALDFEKDEYLETDRENAPWPADLGAAQDLWRRYLKNDVLNQKLSEPDKSLAEITETLEKRYSNQLRIHRQTNNEDVFELFMAAYTHLYDPHTDYMPPRESENFDIHMSLSFEGIGAALSMEGEYVKVERVIPGGPVDRGSLLQAADRIIGVGQGKDGEIVDVIGWRLDDVVDLIRGPKGSAVRLNIIPSSAADNSTTKIVKITRDTVKLEEEAAKKKVIHIQRGDNTRKIGVIELRAFYVDYNAAMLGVKDYRSSTRDVAKLIEELQKQGVDGLILDLRNNGGGSLKEAESLTGLFIEKGPVVQIRYPRGSLDYLGDDKPEIAYDGPLAVMVNRLSASASEILAGAIQDHGRGIIVGNQTFGKGTVQSVEELEPGRLKFTQAKFYRINGDSTQSRGVIPDIQYPVLINADEIGENALPNALEWDQIKPLEYDVLTQLGPVVNVLTEKHQNRVEEQPDFRYLRQRAAFMEEQRKKTRVSLNEKTRRQERVDTEQRLLAMENQRRKAKGLKAFETFAELEEDNERKAEEDKEDGQRGNDSTENYSLLQETGHILMDWLALPQKRQPTVAGQ